MFESPVFLTIIFIIAYVLVCRYFARREGYYSTVMLFGLGCYVYYVGIPLELSLIDVDYTIFGGSEFYFTNMQLSLISAMGTMAFLSFALGYRLSGFNPREGECTSSPTGSKKSVPYSMIFIFLLCVSLVMIAYRSQLSAVHSYAGAYSTTYNNPSFQMLCSTAVFCLAFIASMKLTGEDKRGRCIGILLLICI